MRASVSTSSLGAGGSRRVPFADRLSEKLDAAVELQRKEMEALQQQRKAHLSQLRFKTASTVALAIAGLAGLTPARHALEPVAPLPARDALPSELSPALASAAACFRRRASVELGHVSDSEVVLRPQSNLSMRRKKNLSVTTSAPSENAAAVPRGPQAPTPHPLPPKLFAPAPVRESRSARRGSRMSEAGRSDVSSLNETATTSSLRSLAVPSLATASTSSLSLSPSTSLRSFPPLPGTAEAPRSPQLSSLQPPPPPPEGGVGASPERLTRPDILPKTTGNSGAVRKFVSFFETGLLQTRPSYTRYEVKELAQIFRKFDANGTGDVSKLEIAAILNGRRESVPEDWRHLAEDILAILCKNPHIQTLWFDDILRAVYPWASQSQIDIMMKWSSNERPAGTGAKGPGAASGSAAPTPEKRRQLTRQQLGEIRALFDLYDTEKNGVLSYSDFMRAGATTGLSPAELEALFFSYDDDNNKYMTLDEFTKMCEVLYFWDSETAAECGWVQVPARAKEGGREDAPDAAAPTLRQRIASRAAAAAAAVTAAAGQAAGGAGPNTARGAQSSRGAAAGQPAARLSTILQQSTRPLNSYRNFILPAAQLR